jgi:signal transduction histidine kinase
MIASLFALLLACSAHALEPTSFRFYEDKTSLLTADQVAARMGDLPWTALTEPKPQFGYSDSRFWILIGIPPALPNDQAWLFEIPYSYNEKVGFYELEKGQVVNRSFAGLGVAENKRGPGTLRAGFPTFRVPVPHLDSYSYLMSVEGKFPVALPVQVFEAPDFATHYGTELLILGVFGGIFLFAFLSNATLALSLRSMLYGNYAGFVVFLMMLFLAHEGLTVNYFWPNSPWWAMRELDFYGGFAILFYVFFVREFLGTRRNHPWTDRLLLFMVAVSSVRTVWMLIHPYRFAQMLGMVSVMLSNLLVLFAAFSALRRGTRTARYFLFASLASNLGYVLFVLQGSNLIWIGHWLEWSPIAGSAAEVVLLSFALADRIRQTDRELSLQRSAVVQAEKLGALGRMAGEIAHEINNPLAIIHGNATLLRTLEASPQVKEFAGTIEVTAQRISNVVRGMRALARDSRQDPFQPTPLSSVLQDTMLFCKERSRTVELTVLHLPQDPILRCRSSEISQVLINLLNNSFDAVEGSPSPWVKLEVAPRSGHVELSVIDSGRGIPRELRARIQEPFFTTKEVGKGLGLGLSIARTIVESHGGSLWLDEKSPQTRFVFTVPLAGKISIPTVKT